VQSEYPPQIKGKVAPPPISYNVLRLGEGCLTDAQFSLQTLMAAFAKPLVTCWAVY